MLLAQLNIRDVTQGTLDTYGSLRYVSTTTKHTLIFPRSHSGSTTDGETEEEAEGESRRTDIPPQLDRRCGADAVTGEKTSEKLMRMVALCADVDAIELEGE
jgi:hypothetical protein